MAAPVAPITEGTAMVDRSATPMAPSPARTAMVVRSASPMAPSPERTAMVGRSATPIVPSPARTAMADHSATPVVAIQPCAKVVVRYFDVARRVCIAIMADGTELPAQQHVKDAETGFIRGVWEDGTTLLTEYSFLLVGTVKF